MNTAAAAHHAAAASNAPALQNPAAAAAAWLLAFDDALTRRDATAAAALFTDDGHWRDLLAVTWEIRTVSGRAAVETLLHEALGSFQPKGFRIASGRIPPRAVMRAGADVVEAIAEFSTSFGSGLAVLRLIPDASGPGGVRAWILMTSLQSLHGFEEYSNTRGSQGKDYYAREFGGENWMDKRNRARAYADRDPAVLVVGAGQAGLVDRGAPEAAERRHADHRPRGACRRQLAFALPLADAAQRGARQPPALHALSVDLAGVHPEGQAGELVRVLHRQPRSQLLERHRADRRALRRARRALGGVAAQGRRIATHDASAAHRLRHRRQRDPARARSAGAGRLQGCGDALGRLHRRLGMEGQTRARGGHRQQRARRRAGPAGERRRRSR